VRIEKLSVSGLRSHRGNPPTTLELGDKRLVAIVGHTGAGKSSLLEAITFALFGEATYGGRAYEELSSDGRSEITVQLEFTIGGDRYQLLRTVGPDRHGKFGNKALYLRRVDAHGNVLSQTERVRDVDKVVVGLLGGMTREQFCQAVLLAQNRFAALLEANPATRDALLDTLLGLNALHDARTALQKTRAAADGNIRRLSHQRRFLPENPAAEAKAARARSKAMAEIERRAVACGSNLNELAGQADALSRQITDLERAAELRATAAGPGGIERLQQSVATLTPLCDLDTELSGAVASTSDALETAQTALAQADDALAKAQSEHGTAALHPVVAQQLETLTRLSGERPVIETRLQAANVQLTGLREQLLQAEAVAAAAKASTETLRESHQAAQAEAHNATTAFDRREQVLSNVVGLVERAGTQVDDIDAATTELAGARSALTEAEGALQPLTARVEEATAQFEAARRADSAAFAAHGCHPGEACPVCARALPEDWAPPAAADLDAARSALEVAENARKKAADEHRRAGDARGQVVGHLRSTLGSLSATLGDLATSATEHEFTPPPTPGVDLLPDATADDETLEATGRAVATLPASLAEWIAVEREALVPLQTNRDEALAKLERSATELQEAQARQSGAEAGAAELRTNVAGAEATSNGAADELHSCDERLSATLSQVDERWRALVDLQVPASLEEAGQRLAADQAAVAGAVEKQELATAAVSQHKSTLADIEHRRAQEITAPLAAERATLEGLSQLVGDLCVRLEVAAPAPLDPAAVPAALRDSATALERAAQGAVDVARRRLEDLGRQVDALNGPAAQVVGELVDLMADADPDRSQFDQAPDPAAPLTGATRDVVQRVIGGARTMAADTAIAARRAAEAVGKAKEIDQRVTALQSWSADLASAMDVLKKENFPKWARGVKIADLVDTASEYLSEMTDSRFRFDPTLQISDELAGIVRKASTLSGGEKFEASLALALGVSEIAGRSGVRIETLFLDEGFAGLDESHLNRALDALEREVATGRSIVLITHISAVADRIQDVLLIQPDGAGGSTLKWLDEDERFQLGADLDLAVP
jgi:exonuclease SbcC